MSMVCRFCWTCLIVGMSLVQADEVVPPNVLMICVDDLKPTLGCYGDRIAVTPNIDQLASRGVLFESAYCNQAVCSPSRNALMTGLRPQTIGIYDLPTHFRLAVPDAVTMTQHFMAAGYSAEGLGKIYHVGHGNIDDKGSWSVPSWRSKAPAYLNAQSISAIRPDKSGKKRGPATEASSSKDSEYGDGQTATEAIARLEKLKIQVTQKKQPFFLAVGFIRPHLPFNAPQSYWDLYNPDQLPMPTVTTVPRGAPSYAPTTYGELRNYSDMGGTGPIDQATTRHLIHGYYAATSYMDAQVGRVLDALDQQGLRDNTIVVLWGDHGWHLGDHSMWCKHSNYEQATRIPVIVSVPGTAGDGGARDEVSKAMIETVDIYPTLSDLAGLPQPGNLDGQSFASVVKKPSAAARDYVTHVYPRQNRLGRAIRNERYRMVEWKIVGQDSQKADIELYDYQIDPLETVNIASENPAVVAEMRKVLQRHGEAKPQLRPKAKAKGKAKSTAG